MGDRKSGKVCVETRQLSEAEELLLMRHFDGEVGWFDRRRVQRLIQRDAARIFLQGLEQGKRALCLAEEPTRSSADFWSKIERRIAEEEYTELLLGRRTGNLETKQSGRVASALSNILGAMSEHWRMGASLTAACAAGFVILTSSPLNSGKPATNAAQSSVSANKSAWQSLIPHAIERTAGDFVPSAEFVTMSNSRKRYDRLMERRSMRRSNIEIPPSEIARMLSADGGSPFEVDWMRSDGRLSLIQSTPREPAIIWVKRNAAAAESTPRVIDRDFAAPETVPAFK